MDLVRPVGVAHGGTTTQEMETQMYGNLVDVLKKAGSRAALVAALCSLGLSTAGAAYPEKPVRIVVPFAPGGGTDVMARTLSGEMSKDLGGTVIVESRPGAGTVIGNDTVAKSAPDGHTLLLTTSAFVIVPSFVEKLPYDGVDAFSPIAMLGRGPNVVVVRADSPIKSMQDLLERARANPGKLSYGSPGAGTSVHLSAELLKSMAGVSIVHVPYRGAGPQITDLLGGATDLAVASVPATAHLITAGRLRALAVTTAERSHAWPDVPTVAESGVPGYAADVWYGVFAPKGTPPQIVERLNQALKKASQSAEFKERIENEGVVVSVSTPEELRELATTETARWKAFVAEHKITRD